MNKEISHTTRQRQNNLENEIFESKHKCWKRTVHIKYEDKLIALRRFYVNISYEWMEWSISSTYETYDEAVDAMNKFLDEVAA